MLKVPLYEQNRGYTCGPTCITMLGEFYRLPLTWKAIMKVSKCNKDGMSNQDMVNALKKLGFRVNASSRNSWQDLRRNYERGIPSIVAWMLHGYIAHFSIVVKVTGEHIVLADPDNGERRRMRKNVFMRLWFDYDGNFFPKKAKDIHRHWAATVKGLRGTVNK
jgi:ATP-binding cassette, subfamily B, bacterial